MTARLVPFTVDGLIWAASMVVLDASRRGQPVPRLAAWSLGAGIVATAGANLAHRVAPQICRPDVAATGHGRPASTRAGLYFRVASSRAYADSGADVISAGFAICQRRIP